MKNMTPHGIAIGVTDSTHQVLPVHTHTHTHTHIAHLYTKVYLLGHIFYY
jgi:hypothetical protein